MGFVDNSGNVFGPSSATDNAITRYDGTTGKLIQNSIVTVSDGGHVSPASDNAQDLGSGALSWKDVWFDGSLESSNGGHVRTASSTRLDLGFFSNAGAGFEIYKYTDGTAPGDFRTVYGGAVGQGSVRFIQYDGTNFTTNVLVDASGNVGMGSTAPQSRLHVSAVNAAGDVGAIIQNNSNTAAETTSLYLTDSTAPTNYFARVQSRRVDANTGTLHIGRRQSAAIVDDININSTGQVGVGTASQGSTLQSGGSFAAAITTITTTTTLDSTHYTVLADATSGNITVNLPAVAGRTGRIYTIKKIDSSANTVTIDGNSSETIDGATTQVIGTQWQSLTIQTNGTAWYIL